MLKPTRTASVRVARHCTACGDKTAPLPGTTHFRCPGCGHDDHVNPAPAVGIVIRRGDELLIAKRGQEPKKGAWDFIGGFIDAGEVPEEAARREVQEETGLTVTRLDLLKVAPGDYVGQPTLNFVYTAEVEGEPVAADDVAELHWFHLDDVPEVAWSHEATIAAELREERDRRSSSDPKGA